MQCPTIKSLSLHFVLVFSLNTYNILFLLLKKMKKTQILNEFLTKNLNFQMVLNSIDVYQ